MPAAKVLGKRPSSPKGNPRNTKQIKPVHDSAISDRECFDNLCKYAFEHREILESGGKVNIGPSEPNLMGLVPYGKLPEFNATLAQGAKNFSGPFSIPRGEENILNAYVSTWVAPCGFFVLLSKLIKGTDGKFKKLAGETYYLISRQELLSIELFSQELDKMKDPVLKAQWVESNNIQKGGPYPFQLPDTIYVDICSVQPFPLELNPAIALGLCDPDTSGSHVDHNSEYALTHSKGKALPLLCNETTTSGVINHFSNPMAGDGSAKQQSQAKQESREPRGEDASNKDQSMVLDNPQDISDRTSIFKSLAEFFSVQRTESVSALLEETLKEFSSGSQGTPKKDTTRLAAILVGCGLILGTNPQLQ